MWEQQRRGSGSALEASTVRDSHGLNGVTWGKKNGFLLMTAKQCPGEKMARRGEAGI